MSKNIQQDQNNAKKPISSWRPNGEVMLQFLNVNSERNESEQLPLLWQHILWTIAHNNVRTTWTYLRERRNNTDKSVLVQLPLQHVKSEWVWHWSSLASRIWNYRSRNDVHLGSGESHSFGMNGGQEVPGRLASPHGRGCWNHSRCLSYFILKLGKWPF